MPTSKRKKMMLNKLRIANEAKAKKTSTLCYTVTEYAKG